MTAGNQTPPGGRSDAPVGPGPAPDAEGRSGTPAADPADGGDRTGDDSADRADRADPQAKPNPPVVPARVRMVSRDASTSAVPPNSMPPGRGDQGGHGRPSELLDPARPAGPAQWSDPAERFGTSQLFEPATPPGAAPQAGDETGRTAVPGPTVPWDPSDPRPSGASARTRATTCRPPDRPPP